MNCYAFPNLDGHNRTLTKLETFEPELSMEVRERRHEVLVVHESRLEELAEFIE